MDIQHSRWNDDCEVQTSIFGLFVLDLLGPKAGCAKKAEAQGQSTVCAISTDAKSLPETLLRHTDAYRVA
jgi:hypothetical protein